MKPDRSRLPVILGVLGGVVLLFLVYVGLVEPYFGYRSALADLEDEIAEKTRLIEQKRKEKRQMERWRMLSLAGAPHEATVHYTKFIRPLLAESGLSVEDFPPPTIDAGKTITAAKKPPHTTLAFTLNAKGELAALVKFLEKFDKAPYVHRVKSLGISNESSESSRLAIKMTIEVVIVGRSERHSNTLGRVVAVETLTALQRAPIGVPSAWWNVSPAGPLGQPKQVRRDYQNIAKRNIFLGARPPEPDPGPIDEPEEEDMRKYCRLVSIIHTSQSKGAKPIEALIRNLAEEKFIKLRAVPRSGFDSFRIYSDSGQVQLDAKVLRIDPRDVYFQNKANGRIYALHMDQTVADAMRRSVPDSEVNRLGLLATEEKKGP